MVEHLNPKGGGSSMKKVLTTLACVAVAVSLTGMAYASQTSATSDTVKTKVTEKTGATVTKEKEVIKAPGSKEVIKTEVKETKSETIAKEKDKVKTAEGTAKLKEKEVVTDQGTAVKTNVAEKFKKGDIAKEKVKFVSYSDADGGTIIVIKDKQEVKMPARHYESWKNNVLTKKNKEVTIHSTYDPKLLKPVVTHVE